MPIDASIYGNIQQPQQANPLNALAQAMQIQTYQRAGDKADREEQAQNKLLQLVGDPKFASLPTAQKASALQSVGAFKQAGDLVTTDASANKDQRAAAVSDLDLKVKRLDAAANIAGSVTDQASYERAIPMMQELGFDTSKFSPQYNPEGVKQFAMATLSAKDRLANQTQTRGQDITMRGQDLTQSTALRGQDLSQSTALRGQDMSQETAIRGQDLTNARARDANQNGRVPSGYRLGADGQTLEFIPGGPADPSTPKGKGNLTEGQSKSLVYAARMQEANSIFDELEKGGTTTAVPGSTTPYIGGAITALTGADNQKLVQGKRDFMTAVLRRESGAVISDSEFKNGDQQYFPQIGDTPEVIAQKRRNREIATRGIAADVPESDRRISEVRGPKAGAPMKIANAAEYEKVPSGATYITPDGKTRRKP